MIGQLAQPSPAYKRSARLAVAGLLGFVLAYFALAGWFLWSAWRLGRTALHGTDPFMLWIAAGCCAFFGAFMLKSIFSVRSAMPDGLTEITAKEEPRLFAFLHELADTAGAPRAHRVFLSNRVNAAVFYDLSLLNLLLPSKKNLEIGLPLVNVLPLGELRAVLAHEFGHFAQRSMAVGRWVYVAQQIAGHLVSQRDKFDSFLDGLGRIDLRLRVFAWLLQLVVWSIRSLVEMAFRVVLLMQSALSREMELQADLVAVSLTGSDALIHALHRLQAADDTWQRALHFTFGEKAQGTAVADVYEVQSHIMRRMASILDDDSYGSVPPVPAEAPEQHRVFREQLGHPPKMWQSHPLNHEREANAKRFYVAAPIDGASAWSVFEQPAILRERMSAALAGDAEAPLTPAALPETLQKVGRYYRREQFNRRYCGIYFGRDLTRHAATAAELRRLTPGADAAAEGTFYPPALRDDVRQLRNLREERDQLQALVSGWTSARNGRVKLRGEDCSRRDLPAALARTKQELDEVEGRLRAHDLRCRSWHQDMAAQLGGGWRDYLDGLLAVLHYTEHMGADIADAHGVMLNVLGIETAVRRVGTEAATRIVMVANDLHYLLEQLHKAAPAFVMDKKLCARLQADGNWPAMLGEFTLPLAQRETLGEWLRVIDSWVELATNRLAAVRSAALEQLLVAEALVALHVRRGTVPQPAPAPSVVPSSYPTLLVGAERTRRHQLDWWARFLRADGWVPGTARLLVAGGIVAFALGAGLQQGSSRIHIYNGLLTPLVVNIDGTSTTVAAGSTAVLAVAPADTHRVATHTVAGELVEEFSVPDAAGTNAYNVAGVTPLVEWTAHYGGNGSTPERPQGNPRWLDSRADVVFAEPPKSISTKYGPGTRTVLSALGGQPQTQLQAMPSDDARRQAVLAHARWDDPAEQNSDEWLRLATRLDYGKTLAERLRRKPDDMTLLRLRQDTAGTNKDVVCAADATRAKAAPDNGNLAYLALRCRPDSDATAAAYKAALAHWPANAWLRFAVMRDLLDQGDFRAAALHLPQLIDKLPAMREQLILMAARLQRFQHGAAADIGSYVRMSPGLSRITAMEQGYGPKDGPGHAIAELAEGNLSAAKNMVADTPLEPRVTRLIAASDGASADQVRRSLEMPLSQGIDAATVLPTAGLALRQGRDATPYLKAAGEYFDDMPAIERFLQAVKAGKPRRECEAALGRVAPEARLYAYAAGVVLQKDRAPAEWRKAASTMLFAPERPHFY